MNSIRSQNQSQIENKKIKWSHMCSISSFQFVMTKLHLFCLFLWLFKTLLDQRHVRRYGIVCYSCMTSNALEFISQSSAVQHSACYEYNQTYIISMWQLCSHVIFLEYKKKKNGWLYWNRRPNFPFLLFPGLILLLIWNLEKEKNVNAKPQGKRETSQNE